MVVHAFVQQREDVHDLASKSRDIHCIRHIPLSISWHWHARTDIRHFQPPSPTPSTNPFDYLYDIMFDVYCTYRWHSTCVTDRGSRVRAGALLNTHQVSTDILQYSFIFRIGLLHDQIKLKIIGQDTSLWLTFLLSSLIPVPVPFPIRLHFTVSVQRCCLTTPSTQPSLLGPRARGTSWSSTRGRETSPCNKRGTPWILEVRFLFTKIVF